MITHEPVQAAISYHLSHFEYGDAIFLAERLHAEVDSEDSLYLLARCWFQSGKANCTYSLLNQRKCQSVQCKLLLAKSCIEMRKYSEAEETLIGYLRERPNEMKLSSLPADLLLGRSCTSTPISGFGSNQGNSASLNFESGANPANIPSEQLEEEFGDSASYVAKMMGQICARTDRTELAIIYLKRSLQMNPFLYKSYEMLVELGADVEPSSVFNIPRQRTSSNARSIASNAGLCPSPPVSGTQTTPHPVSSLKRENSSSTHLGQMGLRRSSRLGNSTRANYSVKENTKSTTSDRIDRVSKQPSKKPKRTATSSTVQSNSIIGPQRGENELNEINRNSALNILCEKKREKEQKAASKSNADDLSITKDVNISEEENLKPESAFYVGRSLLANYALSDSALIPLQNQSQYKCSMDELLSLLTKYGKLVYHLSRYESDKVIEEIEEMEPRQKETSYVYTCLGKAYFEQGDYQMACKAFSQARSASPHHVMGMEYYSTALWHLQQEKQLSALAQDMIKHDHNSAQTWCVAGNCFSLQKEHETAIKFLHRAIQLDPEFAYGYTLLGHELVATEEMDHAMACFRNAIRVDPRHYNAWYGLGLIYYKQEKYLQAEIHYKHAHKISPRSPILLCHLAIVRHSLKKTKEALETLDMALKIDPRNALCKFHRASIYFAQERYPDALSELEELREIVPKESLVYFLMGKVHKNINNTHLALMNFSWAMDLDPKGANNQIKEMIDRQYTTEEEDPRTVSWADTE